ncbi:hypothetical protein [Streptomyces diacarni]|uniref:hypothetical protein n=1 Tax=Streptomyces diacarni TaxID=2800381 RepID=UPI0011C058E0|nr:hypothetical protein [Streptomyces diacarni]
MRRCVTTARAWIHAFALLLAVLLAAQGASALPSATAERAPTAAQSSALSAPGEVEHENTGCQARRTARTPTSPPPPGERPLFAGCRAAHSLAATHTSALPETGSAGVPWSRSVEVPVLHQVFRH